ncbi:MAG: translation elongation factor Ts [Bacteriovoracaceae bacterium]|nr:translation elongation factor Ts [Bacteriovoracaceae bacterium]
MSFSANDVKELRERTGAGMMDCKKALTECTGDMEKAIDYLRTKGLAAAAKKQGRVACEGVVCSLQDAKTGRAALLEINCETDFVARNQDFINFVEGLSTLAITGANLSADPLTWSLKGKSVAEWVSELTLKIGEKIDVRRVHLYQSKTPTTTLYGNYTHGSKIAALVEASCKTAPTGAALEEVNLLLKDITMHVAASDTKFVNGSEMDEGFKNREVEIYATQLREQGKPENMIGNILKGKVAKMVSEFCLMEQKFVKNPDIDVKTLVADFDKKHNLGLEIKSFKKFVLGDGIEKPKDNLAEEVAKMGQAAKS